MSKETSWKDAVLKALKDTGSPMTVTEILEYIETNKIRKISGATPASTIYTQTYSLISKGLVEKVGRATFLYRSDEESVDSTKETPITGTVSFQEDTPGESGIINCFGMFWSRDNVLWKSNPRIEGKQSNQAKPVDFSNVRGIYLLHDGREVIYVGQALDQTVGQRLFQHTSDRLNGRWDRFSWFGFQGVDDGGALKSIDLKSQVQSSYGTMTDTLEAILVEAAEPRQNRKRGNNFNALEFNQSIASDMKDRETKAALQSVIDKLDRDGQH